MDLLPGDGPHEGHLLPEEGPRPLPTERPPGASSVPGAPSTPSISSGPMGGQSQGQGLA